MFHCGNNDKLNRKAREFFNNKLKSPAKQFLKATSRGELLGKTKRKTANAGCSFF